ncbi:MAG TPA: hypothetical protein DCZ69_16600 [Syntrophobacteraceae bacterium]|jgi:hypothetical protein|nr:hypothetical protein [Syntrophobacteraceae bacterium]HBD09871.1 hypothetical protein [Syntrophobacteraceae bacterium]HBZ56054.1 hypothetical protein [Syntrophobacteraceae bacterium]
MAREHRPNARESAVISRLDHAKEAERVNAMYLLREHLETLSNRIAIRLIEKRLVETTNKDELENQLGNCLRTLLGAEEFDIQYFVANVRQVVPRPHFVSLYLTAFIVEKLIEHKTIVDVFGTDEEIYRCVNNEVYRLIPLS